MKFWELIKRHVSEKQTRKTIFIKSHHLEGTSKGHLVQLLDYILPESWLGPHPVQV